VSLVPFAPDVPFIGPLVPVSSYCPVPDVPPMPVLRVWTSPERAAAPAPFVALISGEVVVVAGVVSRRVS
jgi:hypothetical protein